MNDTGGGVTAIHDVPGDITRIGFHWMLLFFLSVTRRGFFCFVFTRSVSEVTGFFFVPRLVLGPTDQREVIMAQLQISVAYFCSIGLYFLV